jgi:gliding motility-associated protein GldC
MSRTAEIHIKIDLDAENLPTNIEWEASEAREPGPVPCQSVMLSLWNSDQQTTAAIDLWTKDTSVDDMNLYFYQVIHKMADTYLRATRNEEVANSIRDFGNGFGDALGLQRSPSASGASGSGTNQAKA